MPEGTACARRHGTAVSSPSSVVSTSRESASGIKVINSTARMVNATLISRRARAVGCLDLSGRADAGGDPVDRPRPAAAVQLLLRGPEPSMITRPALRLDPPVPAHHRGRGHHHRAPHHRLARRDRLGPRDQQRRPAVPARARPHRPDQRRHRDGHHHRPGSRLIPTGDLHPGDRGPGRDRVERHAEAPGEKIGFRHRVFYREPPPIPGTPRRARPITAGHPPVRPHST